MAIFTASVSGDWNDSATWGGAGIPGTGDTANINGDIVVTIPNGYSAAALIVSIAQTANSSGLSTLINNGTLTMDSGQYLKVGGGANRDGKLVLGPGSQTVIPSNLYFNNGYIQSTGTKASPAQITGNGNLTTTAVTGPRQNVNLSNVSFRLAGDINFVLQDTTGLSSGASTLTISNCVFAGQRSITFGATDTPAATPISITNCDFRDMVTTRSITIRRTNGGSATYEFRHNTMSQAVSGTNYIKLAPTTSTGLAISGNVFDNASIQESSPGGSIIRENFHTSKIAVSPGFANLNNGSGATVTRNYIRPGADNGNGLSSNGTAGSGTHSITENVLEGNVGTVEGVSFTGRPDFYLPNATPLPSNVTENLIIGCGELCVGYNVPNWQTLNIKNNTMAITVASGTDSGGSVYVSEGLASSGTINIANNLVRGNGSAGGQAIIGSSSGAAQVIAYSDYNSFYNETLAYSTSRLAVSSGNTTLSVPGAHDIAENPVFYDETRNLANWNALFGSGVNTAAEGVSYLLSLNGYRGSPNYDQNGTASVYGPLDLLDWVRDGFFATNSSLRNAGDPSDGSPTIGIGFFNTVSTGFFFSHP